MESKIFSDNVYILDGFKSLENINRPMFSLRDTGKQINIGVE